MSGIEESKDSGEGWIEWVGYALLVSGLGVLAVAVGCGLWFWFGELVPFFWGRGNPWPAILPLAFVATVIGGAMASNNKES